MVHKNPISIINLKERPVFGAIKACSSSENFHQIEKKGQ